MRGLLSLLVFSPAIGALLVAAVPKTSVGLMQKLAVLVSLVPLARQTHVWSSDNLSLQHVASVLVNAM